MSAAVTIIDYGVGNLFSVRSAITKCGAEVIVSDDGEQIEKADRLLLPGVGAFAPSMNDMRRHNLIEPLENFLKQGRPLLGICLGMQMLFDVSEEFGLHDGLGLIPGRVFSIPSQQHDGSSLRIPHVGWEEISSPPGRDWGGTLMDGIALQSSFYFAHSFRAVPEHEEHLIASCMYGGHDIPAVVGNENIHGCQFHPEKSGSVGLKIISNFLAL